MGKSGPPTVEDLLGGIVPQIDPLICSRANKATREAENTLSQLEYVEYLINRGVTFVRDSHVLELQSLAVDGIYPCAGKYRTVLHDVRLKHGKHIVPDAAAVPQLVLEALARINGDRSGFGIPAAAYALWRINWIHPFAGGNGRTARAIAYLILCIEHGAMLPGSTTIPAAIAKRGTEYTAALQLADRAEAAGEEDLSGMVNLVVRAASEQLKSSYPVSRE